MKHGDTRHKAAYLLLTFVYVFFCIVFIPLTIHAALLKWDPNPPSENVTHYLVFIAQEQGVYDAEPSKILSITNNKLSCDLSECSYNLDNLAYLMDDGEEYFFRLKARNDFGDSAFSDDEVSFVYSEPASTSTVVPTTVPGGGGGSGSSTTSTGGSTTSTSGLTSSIVPGGGGGSSSTTSSTPSSSTAELSSSTTTTANLPPSSGGGGGGSSSGGGGGSSSGDSGGGGIESAAKTSSITSTVAVTTSTSVSTTTVPSTTTSILTTTTMGPDDTGDSDGDGIPDEDEATYGTSIDNPDTDQDGLFDGEELGYWLSDWDADPDSDGLINLLDQDSDNDGYPDGFEIAQNAKPDDPNSTPDDSFSILVGQGANDSEDGSIEVIDNEFDKIINVHIDWYEYNFYSGEARLAACDIDGDKKDEIIIGLGPVEEDASIPGGRFQILDDDYTSLGWGRIEWDEYNELNGETWPACGDVDGDDKDEIVMGLGPGGGGKLEVFDYLASGTIKHRHWITVDWQDYNMASGETRPACGNIDLDRRDEIVIGFGRVDDDDTMPGGKFVVLDDNYKDFSVLDWGQILLDDYNAVNGETWPSCGDIDLDYTDEIIIGLGAIGAGKLEVFDFVLGRAMHSRWIEINWREYDYDNGETRPSCGNIDYDIKDEVIIGLGPGGAGLVLLYDPMLNGFSTPFAELQSFTDYPKSSNIETWPVIKGVKTRISWWDSLVLQGLKERILRNYQ